MIFQPNDHEVRTIVQSENLCTTKRAPHSARVWNKEFDQYAAKPVADEDACAGNFAERSNQ